MPSISFITLKTDKPIKDFAAERNKLLTEAKTDWVFFVDSDEKVTAQLKKEIPDAARMTNKDGFYVKRKDYFFGKWLRFGETGNIKLLRLGRKGVGKWKRPVHEVWEITNTGELKNPLLHYPHPTISDFIKSLNHYSDIDAKEFGYFNLAEVLYKPIGKFVLNYFFRLGFLDGTAGFVMAYMMSLQSLVVRVKMYEVQ